MQLRNATASLDAPLHFPPNVVLTDQFPRTKQDLLKLTGLCIQFLVRTFLTPFFVAANSLAVAQAHDLAVLPVTPPSLCVSNKLSTSLDAV
jgi:hypothetical protein